jgi:hypothetical protein
MLQVIYAAYPNTEKKNCIHTTMIENLNIKLKNVYVDEHFKKKICSINTNSLWLLSGLKEYNKQHLTVKYVSLLSKHPWVYPIGYNSPYDVSFTLHKLLSQTRIWKLCHGNIHITSVMKEMSIPNSRIPCHRNIIIIPICVFHWGGGGSNFQNHKYYRSYYKSSNSNPI